MAIQNINLYREELADKRVGTKTTNSFALLAVLALLGIGGNVGFVAWEVYQQKETMAKLTAESADITAKLTELTVRLLAAEGLTKDTDIDAMELRIRELRGKRKALQVYLQNEDPGFSEFLIALARQHVNGMWLTSVALTNKGREVELEGRSTRAELVTEYLARLNFEPEFTGVRFQGFRISKPESKSVNHDIVQFHVSTEKIERVGK